MKRKNSPVETARTRFARNLKNRRLELELSQEELAHLAGLHRTYIGGVERGERNPTIDSMERMADALRSDVVELLKP